MFKIDRNYKRSRTSHIHDYGAFRKRKIRFLYFNWLIMNSDWCFRDDMYLTYIHRKENPLEKFKLYIVNLECLVKKLLCLQSNELLQRYSMQYELFVQLFGLCKLRELWTFSHSFVPITFI